MRTVCHGEFPERKKPLRRRLQVEEYAEYLRFRWDQGNQKLLHSFHEIRQRDTVEGAARSPSTCDPWRKTGTRGKRSVQTQVTLGRRLFWPANPTRRSPEQTCTLGPTGGELPELGLIRAASAYCLAIAGDHFNSSGGTEPRL